MEHFKSTIATTAVLVMGLVTAAQILHPRDPAREMRRGNPIVAAVAASDGATAWSDPPARASQPVAAQGQAPRPASFTMLPVAMTASLSGAEVPLQPRRTRKAEPANGQRHVQLANRSRSASAGQDSRAELPGPNPSAASGQPGKAAQGDPIGDLLKGLGIGRDSES